MAILFNVTFNAHDPRRLGEFWSATTGYTIVEETDQLVRLRGPKLAGAPDLLVLRADKPAAAGNRVHLDLAADDVAVEIARLVRLGASLVDGGSPDEPNPREANDLRWFVLRDPEGNEFCLGSTAEASGRT